MTLRVLLVDDSSVVLTVLQRILASSPEIEVVGTARNGREALNLIPHLKPSVICTDYHMPVLDGLALTREVMANHPCPILVVSSAVGPSKPDQVFSLLEAGAIDVFPKPRGGLDPSSQAARDLVNKVKLVAGVCVIGRRAVGRAGGTRPAAPPAPGLHAAAAREDTRPPSRMGLSRVTAPPLRIVAIGASTGGPQALLTVLGRLPADFPAPLLCVQHISHGFLTGLVEWLDAHSALKVRIARTGDPPSPGTAYFPEEDRHLVLDRSGRLVMSTAPPVDGHRPSATVTFESLAERCHGAAAAILLTGMGRDGVEGMRTIARGGGLTIAQDEASCVVYGMPKQAIETGAAQLVLPLADIPAALLKAAGG